jgi:hypothetical protein
MQIEVPVCPHHGNRISFGTITSFILLPQIIILGLVGLANAIPLLMLGGLLSTLCGLILLIWSRNPVWAWFIRTEYGLIKGAHPEFIESMPPWDGEAI